MTKVLTINNVFFAAVAETKPKPLITTSRRLPPLDSIELQHNKPTKTFPDEVYRLVLRTESA
jgi:hypothetical protein